MQPHDTTATSGELRAEKRGPAKHDDQGREIGDPTPMQPPLGYVKTPSLSEQIQQQVRIALIKRLEDEMEPETEDEADDFIVPDEDGFEPSSLHENDHIPSIGELKRRALELNEQIRIANTKQAIEDNKNALRKSGTPAAQPPDNSLSLEPKSD